MESDTHDAEAYPGGAGIAAEERTTSESTAQQDELAPTPAQTEADGTDDDDADGGFIARVTRNRNLAEDVAAAVHWNAGQSLFLSVDDKIREALAPAYLIYLHLLNDPEAWEEVLRYPPFAGRERRQKAGTEAVVAVMLVAKPRNEQERDRCSELATALIWAELEEVLPEHFAERVAKNGLRACRDYVRDVRRAVRRPLRSNKQPHPETKAASTGHAEEPTQPQGPLQQSGTPSSTAPQASEETPEAPERPPVSEPAQKVPPLSPPPATTSSPAAAPKKVHAATHERVRSAVGFGFAIFDEAGKHVLWPLTPAETKALRAVSPKGFRRPAAYLRALADALEPRPPGE
jgi:hypothetical protein